jgi:hypothetical protein
VDEVFSPGPYRPVVQLVARGALWAALGLGSVGGSVALLGVLDRDDPAAAAPAEEAPAAAGDVPAPVAGTAELAVEEWLTATEEDAARLDELFVEPVVLPPSDEDADVEVEVQRTTTVSGHVIQEGYWVVTVRAEIVEHVADEVQPAVTWWVEVGVVGDAGNGLAPLTTPAVMPAPAALAEGWQSSRPNLQPPLDDDAVAATVQGFLDALLTGQSDPAPYLAPGAVVPLASEPPFVDVVVEGIASEEQEDGDVQVWVDVMATSPGGREQPAAYELVVTPRADAWEIRFVWGAPSLGAVPADG